MLGVYLSEVVALRSNATLWQPFSIEAVNHRGKNARTNGDEAMNRWTAELDWTPDAEPAVRELDDWKHRLLRVFGGVHVFDGVVTMTVFVSAPSVRAACDSAVALVEPVTGQSVTGVRVLPVDEHERRARHPIIPALAGDADIANLAGVSLERARELGDLDGFPPVIATTEASGPLRLETEVLGWITRWDPVTGLPRIPCGEDDDLQF